LLFGLMCATGYVMQGDAAKVEPVVKLHPLAAVTVRTTSNSGLAGTFVQTALHAHTPSSGLTIISISVMYANDPNDMAPWAIVWINIWRRSRLPDPPANKGAESLAYIRATSDNVIDPFRS